MKVLEFIAVLSSGNPNSAVIRETRSEAHLVINPRPGIYEAGPPGLLTVADEDFLGALRIRHARSGK